MIDFIKSERNSIELTRAVRTVRDVKTNETLEAVQEMLKRFLKCTDIGDDG